MDEPTDSPETDSDVMPFDEYSDEEHSIHDRNEPIRPIEQSYNGDDQNMISQHSNRQEDVNMDSSSGIGENEPNVDHSEPVRNLNEPVRNLNEPIRYLSEPMRNLSEPIRNLREPVNNDNEPNINNSDPRNLIEPITDREPIQNDSEPINQSEHSNARVNQNEPDSAIITNDDDSNQTVPYDDDDSSSLSEPPKKIPKLDNTLEDGETCPICLDSWGSSGEHRLVSLKCGHLFGAKCVERWLKAKQAKDRNCPTCKTKAKLSDIRHIFAKKLIAVDTSELHSVQKKLETVQAEKNRLEMELQNTKIAHRACLQQIEVMRSTLTLKEPSKLRNCRFALEKNMEILKDGGCRVLAYNCRTYELYVSQKSSNPLFPGFGIRRISCINYSLNQFTRLHPKPIRDVSYSQSSDMLLSVSLDATARIMERGTASLHVNANSPLWSCTWDCNRVNEFYVGGAGGVVSHYDIRNTSAPLNTLQPCGDMTPIVSICSTDVGLLTCSLNNARLWTQVNGDNQFKTLPGEGKYMSMCYSAKTRRVLLNGRPNGAERSKMSLFKLNGFNEVTADLEATFRGSSKSTCMSRASWLEAYSNTWIAAHSESDAAIYLHGVDGSRPLSLPASELTLDLCPFDVSGDVLLAALSESRLRVYRALQAS